MLAAALLYYMDDSGVTGWMLAACAFHELGHWWAIRALGGRIQSFRLSCAGAELRLSSARQLPPERMVLCALAGPGMNLVTAAAAAFLARHGAGGRLYFFTGVNLGLAAFNLLPAAWLDGGRAVECMCSAIGRAELGRRLTGMCSVAVAGALLLAGAVLLWESEGRNFTVLAAGVWLTAAARREKMG